LGGFSEGHAVVGSDIDFCLRTRERGKRVVYTPHAVLTQHAAADEAPNAAFDARGIDQRWARTLGGGDPFYHPNLNRDPADFSYEREPLEYVNSGHPLFEKRQIRRILAVKLDHIGDFVTAIPALRRLRETFPEAELYLLTAPASAALCGMISGLSEIIEFEYFFARSDRGLRELSAEEVSALRQRLGRYEFDLAIDLRKAPETRPILPVTGATWLAGFDRDGNLPWLDIALEWEQDPPAKAKRSPVGDDLIRLVDAVAIAAESNRGVLQAPDFPGVRAGAAAALLTPAWNKQLICVHPGVGSQTRQWPTGHFATLIDLLVAAYDAEIVLIGAQEEAAIADEVIAKVRRGEAVRSLAGKIPLSDLPHFLETVELFIGNNSGPHHLAAALGVPTIGVHSGAVDAREWGPLGPNAVALRRRMECSPCYLANRADCWRDIACLAELRPEEVFQACRRLLAIGSPKRSVTEIETPRTRVMP
jgi:ADP-heptose:LPS heptosyltransferase